MKERKKIRKREKEIEKNNEKVQITENFANIFIC